MSIDDDVIRLRLLFARIADPTERDRADEAFSRILLEMHGMKARIASAQATLSDMRDELESQMEFWRPKKDEA